MKLHPMLAGAAVLALAACVTDAPSVPDTDDPHIRVSFSNGGRAIVQSSDERDDPREQCLTVRGGSVDVQATFTDGGGLQLASISVSLGGAVDESSIRVSPEAPDISWRFDDTSTRDSIIVRLTPPSSGEVRTGVVVDFTVGGPFPAAITADARDYAGNQAFIDMFDLRDETDDVVCIGD